MRNLNMIFKFSLLLLIFLYIFKSTNLEKFNILIKSFNLNALLTTSIIFLLLIFIQSYRLSICINFIQPNNFITLKKIIISSFIGNFFNQIIPTTISGDLYRAFSLKNIHISKKKIFQFIILDRYLSISFMYFFSFFLNFFIDEALKQMATLILIIVLFFILMAFVFLFFSYLNFKKNKLWNLIYEFSNLYKQTLLSPGIIYLFILIVFCQLCIGTAIWLILNELTNEASIIICIFFTPLVLSAAMLPFSISGWGFREIVFLYFLNNLNISNESLILSSIFFGISVLFSTLPGFFFYFFKK